MKKYILLALFVAFGLSQFVPSFDVFSESSSSSNTGQYTRKADQAIKTYIARLEKSGFSNSDIIATLEKVKAVYVKKKSESNYTGNKKITIDAIINALEKAINERKGQDNDDEDLYDLFNTIPTTTTTVTNTYYSGTTNTNCTKEYVPVCGVKTSSSSCTPDGRCYVSDGMMSTYSNKCELLKAKATYLYSGACKTTIDPPSTPMCTTGTFTNSSCICKDGKSPRMVDSGTRVQMYTCEAAPVKLPPVTTCGKGIFYTGDCLCSNGKSPIVIAKNSIGQQAYSCDPTVIITPPVCTKEYAPVCATPKSSCTSTYCTDVMPTPKTYDNKCMMYAAEATYLYSGACKIETPQPVVCTKEYSPVCGSMETTTNCTPDGRCSVSDGLLMTFSNKCELEKAKAKYVSSGVCKSTIDLPTPICSTGTLTNSDCICKDGKSPRALASGTRIQAHTCDPVVVTPPSCTKEYAPVCASMESTTNCAPDGKCYVIDGLLTTFNNKCELEKTKGKYLYSGVCKTEAPIKPPVCATGNFANSNCVCSNGNAPSVVDGGTKIQMYTCDTVVTTQCTTEYAPVCGQFTPVCATGMDCLMAYPMPTTYTNKCELLKARASYLYSGVCTSDM